MDGVSLARKKSRQYLNKLSIAWVEPFLLLGSGALAVVLHQSLRFPLGLPGRHGIEWISLLVIGRITSRYRWAGILTSIGAAGTCLLPIWGFVDPYRWLVYLFPGIVMDVFVYWLPETHSKVWVFTILGGLAHATKPLLRWVISLVSGCAFGSLLLGLAYPLLSHILFGMIGGLLGTLIALAGKRWVDRL